MGFYWCGTIYVAFTWNSQTKPNLSDLLVSGVQHHRSTLKPATVPTAVWSSFESTVLLLQIINWMWPFLWLNFFRWKEKRALLVFTLLCGTGSCGPKLRVSLSKTEETAWRKRSFTWSGSEIMLSSAFCLEVVNSSLKLNMIQSLVLYLVWGKCCSTFPTYC